MSRKNSMRELNKLKKLDVLNRIDSPINLIALNVNERICIQLFLKCVMKRYTEK